MLRSNARRAIAIVSLFAAAGPLFAAPADQVRARIAGFRELGASFKTVNDSLRTPEPQTFLIQIAARQIVGLSRDMPGWFPAGSGLESGAKTKAKAEIWSQAVKFKAAQGAFAKQALVLQAAAQSGLAPAIRAETAKLGKTCKGCHDTFRAPGE